MCLSVWVHNPDPCTHLLPCLRISDPSKSTSHILQTDAHSLLPQPIDLVFILWQGEWSWSDYELYHSVLPSSSATGAIVWDVPLLWAFLINKFVIVQDWNVVDRVDRLMTFFIVSLYWACNEIIRFRYPFPAKGSSQTNKILAGTFFSRPYLVHYGRAYATGLCLSSLCLYGMYCG